MNMFVEFVITDLRVGRFVQVQYIMNRSEGDVLLVTFTAGKLFKQKNVKWAKRFL